MSGAVSRGVVYETVSRTRFAASATLRRSDAKLVFAGFTLAYLLGYLYAIGHLSAGSGRVGLVVADDPLSKLLQPSLGPFTFEGLALFRLGPVTYLFSFNTVLGLGIAALVGLNLAITYLAWRQPAACGIGSSSAGVLAGIPALLSGAACCGPILLLVIGVQASGLLLTTFDLLIPLAVVLLVGSLLLVGRQVDPTRV